MLFGTQATAQKLEITPDPLELGERPIDAWMRSEAFTLTNTSSDEIILNNAELDAPAFFLASTQQASQWLSQLANLLRYM